MEKTFTFLKSQLSAGSNLPVVHLTTITVGPGFLGNFVLLLLKNCSLYHEKPFIQEVNDISSQVFNNFFSASDIMEAVRGRFYVSIGMNARLRDTS